MKNNNKPNILNIQREYALAIKREMKLLNNNPELLAKLDFYSREIATEDRNKNDDNGHTPII